MRSVTISRSGIPSPWRTRRKQKPALPLQIFVKNYVYHYLYLSQSAYEKAFGGENGSERPSLSASVDGTSEDEDSLTTDLLKCRDVAGASFTTELSRSFGNTIASINYIVIVLIILPEHSPSWCFII